MPQDNRYLVLGAALGLGAAAVVLPRLGLKLGAGPPSVSPPQAPEGDLDKMVQELRTTKTNLEHWIQTASARMLTEEEREEAMAVIDTAVKVVRWFDQLVASGAPAGEQLPEEVRKDLSEVKQLVSQLNQLLAPQVPDEEPGERGYLEFVGTPTVNISGDAVTITVTVRNSGIGRGQWEVWPAIVADVQETPDIEVEEEEPSDGSWWQKLANWISNLWDNFLNWVRSIDWFPATSWLGAQTVILEPGEETTLTFSGTLPNVPRQPIGCIVKAGRKEERVDRPADVQYGPIPGGAVCRVRSGEMVQQTAPETVNQPISGSIVHTASFWRTIYRWSGGTVSCSDPTVMAQVESYRVNIFSDIIEGGTWQEATLIESGQQLFVPPSDYVTQEQLAITDAYDLVLYTWTDTPVQCDKPAQVTGVRTGKRVVTVTNTVTGESRQEEFTLRDEPAVIDVSADKLAKLYPRISWNVWLQVQATGQESPDTHMWQGVGITE